ncbi:hypothetical protein ONE63_006998 [Megalurothrips usitatus]|uniref:Carboxylesterase type B domain-containing protein n=1 Tax=Megalurothrips usitatus TaxID=439358 RepID=A0AAV7XRG0_9NEOP|nr:hypothetical protein ONE63_006998 [Megalurothrips usitatus]
MGAVRQSLLAAVVLAAVAVLLSVDRAHGRPANAPADARPSARTAAGEVRGRWEEAQASAAAGRRFAAYLGVPYGKPPVGHLRFKAPAAAEAWSGALDATSDPPACPQINVLSEAKEVVGQEDCLYLNVYVPGEAAADDPPRPVLFLVHGGGFDHGSGRLHDFGPDLLLHAGVVVVSVNYRLGPLGFLSLDDEAIPGNAGLKDLVLALKWVRTNIAAFGGDPARVTALGWSTGASAVHILSLLPAARGLFSRMVLLSGHAVSPRAYTERHVERANTLAAILGAADNSTEAVSRVLREAPVERLLRANDDPRMRRVGQPLPSPERRAADGAEPKLLLRDPESLLRQPQAAAMPTLLGVEGRAGTFPFKIWDRVLSSLSGLDSRSPGALDELLPRLMPGDLLPGSDTAAALGLTAEPAEHNPGPGPLGKDASLRLAQLVRDEYSSGGPIANNTDTFIEFLGDAFLYASAWRAVGFMGNASTEQAPLRLFRFLVDDDYNYAKKLYGVTAPGATLTDALGYLGRFNHSADPQRDAHKDTVAAKTVGRMINMVTTFAKGEEASLPQWPAVPRSADPASWPQLLVGPGLSLRVGHVEAPHQAFWSSVYRDLRSRTSTIGRH